MKKLIILVLFAFTSSFVMANEAPDTVQTDFKHVVYKDVKDVIKSLADALKVGTDHVYGVLIKQQIVNSIVYILLFIIGIICVVICAKQATKVSTDNYGDVDSSGIFPLICSTVLGIVGLILLFIGLINLDTTVTGFINPEYGAIVKIIEILK